MRVTLINLKSLGTNCGWGEGRTLIEAQNDALEKARKIDPQASLGPGGYQCFFCALVLL